MPTQDFGVYPDSLTAGTEVSSTYEGRHVTVTAAELLTSDGSGIATKGLPCVFGLIAGNQGVGVCFATGTLTDLIAIDTEGIWNLSVVATDDGGAMLVSGGDPLYIHRTTGVISKIRNNATQIPFGYALGQITAGATAVIAVKVHWDPISHWLLDQEMLYFGDLRDVSIEWDETNLEMLPLVDDTGTFSIGNGTLSMDVQIFGATAASYLLYDSSASTLDLAATILGAATENALGITVADGVTGAGIYGRGLYVNYDNNGIKTGAAESNGIGVDMDADADVVGLFAVNTYIGALNGATINRVACYSCYMEEVTGTINAADCIHLETAVQAATTHDFISMRSHALQQAMISDRSGGATATYLLWFEGVNAPAEAFNAAGNGAYSIACRINNVLTYLHTYDAP